MERNTKTPSRRKGDDENNRNNRKESHAASIDEDEDDADEGNKSSDVSSSSDDLDSTGNEGSKKSSGNQPSASATPTRTEIKDYSRVPPPSPRTKTFFQQQPPTFPVILHDMISDPSLNDIIAWLPHGRAWRIIQPHAFANQIVPQYFQHGRFSSFARQVSGWGFHRITSGVDTGAYYHEQFLRGKRHLCYQMKRLKSKPKGIKGRAKDVEDLPPPDFYAMERDNPLPLTNECDMVTSVRAAGPPLAVSAASVPAPAEVPSTSNHHNNSMLQQGSIDTSSAIRDVARMLAATGHDHSGASALSSLASLVEATTSSGSALPAPLGQNDLDSQISVLKHLKSVISSRLDELYKTKERNEAMKQQQIQLQQQLQQQQEQQRRQQQQQEQQQRQQQQEQQRAVLSGLGLGPELSSFLLSSIEGTGDVNGQVMQLLLQNELQQPQQRGNSGQGSTDNLMQQLLSSIANDSQNQTHQATNSQVSRSPHTSNHVTGSLTNNRDVSSFTLQVQQQQKKPSPVADFLANCRDQRTRTVDNPSSSPPSQQQPEATELQRALELLTSRQNEEQQSFSRANEELQRYQQRERERNATAPVPNVTISGSNAATASSQQQRQAAELQNVLSQLAHRPNEDQSRASGHNELQQNDRERNVTSSSSSSNNGESGGNTAMMLSLLQFLQRKPE